MEVAVLFCFSISKQPIDPSIAESDLIFQKLHEES